MTKWAAVKAKMQTKKIMKMSLIVDQSAAASKILARRYQASKKSYLSTAMEELMSQSYTRKPFSTRNLIGLRVLDPATMRI